MKKLCAVFGTFRNEKYLLPIWLKYYSNLFGMENLYVIDHQTTDGSTENLKCNYEVLDDCATDELQRFGSHDYPKLWNVILKKYEELLNDYQYVINIDSDEIIMANPDKYRDLRHYVESMGVYSRCIGYEIVHRRREEPDLQWNKLICEQRKYWIRESNMDKPAITSKMLDWMIGKHYIKNHRNELTDPDLILCHLHRVDYNFSKAKYFMDENVIEKLTGSKKIDDISFQRLFGGYPIFSNIDAFNSDFDDPNCNTAREAIPAQLEEIPSKYKGIF